MKEFKFRPYQRKAFSRMLANKHFALFAGMSLGKTALTLSLIDFVMYDDAEITKVFVISHIAYVKTVEDLNELKALLDAENAGKKRSTVIQAINARVDEISNV